MLELSHVRVEVDGRPLLNDFTATFPAAGLSAVVGPNGAGKSVMLRAVMELIPRAAGNIRSEADRTALVFQRPTILRRTVEQNIGHALAIAGRNSAPERQRLLQLGELDTAAQQPARTLSGGEQQRLALVRALANQPQLLLLDEPTAALDPAATSRIELIIKQIVARGTKVILVTHNLPQARRLATDTSLILNGRMIEQAPTEAFFKTPTTVQAARFVAGETP